MASRHPPAFQVIVGPQRRLQALVALLAMIAVASGAGGLALHLSVLAGLFLLVPVAGVLAWRLAWVEPRSLQWDGQCWRLASLAAGPGTAQAVALELLFDLGDALLLRARESDSSSLMARRIYLPLTRASVGAEWGALRATLHAARPAAASVSR